MPYYNIDNGRYYTDSSCTTECDSKGNVVGEKLISAILAPILLLIFLSYFFRSAFFDIPHLSFPRFFSI